MTTRAQTRPAPGDTMTIPVAVPRRWPPRLVGPVAAVWMLLPLLSLHAADPPTKEFVLKQYRQSLEALRTFECELRIETTYRSVKPTSYPAARPSIRHIRWTQDGDRFAALSETVDKTDGSVSRGWSAFDGETGTHWSDGNEAAGRPPNGSITLTKSVSFGFLAPPYLMGVNVGRYGTSYVARMPKDSFEDLLQRPRTTIRGWEQQGEHQSVVIQLPDLLLDDDLAPSYVHTTVSLDPEHGYLPSRIRSIRRRSQKVESETLLEMRTFENLSSDPARPVWFPKVAVRSDLGRDELLTVERVRLNPDVAVSDFTPQFPPQTVIEDMRIPVDQRRSKAALLSEGQPPTYEYPPALQKLVQKVIAATALGAGFFLLVRRVLRRPRRQDLKPQLP